MRKLAIGVLLVALIPMQAQAFDKDAVLGLVAMPLAVAAVSDVAGVPSDDLSKLVVTLNEANVPPARFVQVIRYVPVALVRTDQPTFVQFVRDEVSRGVTGDALVTVIDQRIRTYDVTPELVTLSEPATTFVIRDDYIPPAVITRVTEWRTTTPVASFDTNDLLALIAIPLAVDAVSNLTGVPQNDLASFVSLLNQGNVAPVQMVEVLRYVPVALVPNDQPNFIEFVQQQTSSGVTGTQLVTVVTQRLRTYDITPDVNVSSPSRVIYVDANYIPPVVVQRVARAKSHPHGGPPGQLKKIAGVQTGAEIVHGEKRASTRGPGKSKVSDAPPRTMVSSAPAVTQPPRQAKQGGRDHDGSSGKGKKHDGGGHPEKGKGKKQGKG